MVDKACGAPQLFSRQLGTLFEVILVIAMTFSAGKAGPTAPSDSEVWFEV